MQTDPLRISAMSQTRAGKIRQLIACVDRAEWGEVSALAKLLVKLERLLAQRRTAHASRLEKRLKLAFAERSSKSA